MKAEVLAAMVMISGCSGGSDAEATAQARSADFLSAVQIRQLFEGGPVRLQTPALEPVEVFRPDGTYLLSGRASTWGRYRVGEGVLCVQLDGGEERCRSVFRDSQGRLFLGDNAGSKHPAVPVNVQPVAE